ncbi:MAG: class II fructose-bisphosphate aldolase [Rhodospirillum sp.]|nr:class II fructose-bisphosphate aldolase [Rhodospirillum sp.]MCF8490949.1 class II fructose-bisphosphate aldolase [Rhodospirillum sp.]MCF8501467.1 class II fructose-bisphosphate aldolase [Rhodospirillum sp.]
MPLAPMAPMLRSARRSGYAIAAYNMIDYNSVRSMVAAAVDLDAPLIVQVSVKTVRHWGYRPIASWVRALAEDAPVPVALHLDHCTDVAVIRDCIDAGWTSVMYDGSSKPFEENLATSSEIYALTQAAGVGLEAEIGAIGGVEDDKVVAGDAARLADFDECVSFCEAMPNLAVFAPAIGTAHGMYRGEPVIDYTLLERVAKTTGMPIALHGGTGLTEQQFKRCIGLGCAKVNISTMHKMLFIKGFVDLARDKPDLGEPLPFIAAQHDAMKADVMAMIKTFGSAGKAADAAAG